MAPGSEIDPQHLGTLWVLHPGQLSLVGPMPRVAVIYQSVGQDAASLIGQAMELDEPSEVLQRFAAGKRCYTGTVEGTLATFGWVTFDEELIGELRLRIRLSPGEAYIWNCVTLPAYRGQRLYPALLWHMINDLREEGIKRIWIGADADNLPSQTGISLCGFQPIIDMVLDRVLAIRMTWARGCPGAPPQLVEEARRKLFGNRHEAWQVALSSPILKTTANH